MKQRIHPKSKTENAVREAESVLYANDYEPSYSKYGGYNDYDDDTIDSAFEGMPEATWNA